jgi:sigma-B regulation protein RsbU (phosphoserine phosphatase)
MIEELQVDQYFTMAYAEIDLATGAGTLVQAGHPHPMIIGAHGGVTILGSGGLPIGLIDDAQFPQVAFQLAPGDRLFLMSDGVTECPDIAGEELGTEGLERILRDNIYLQDGVLLEALVWELSIFAGGHDFPDDVSGILFDYLGPDPASAK